MPAKGAVAQLTLVYIAQDLARQPAAVPLLAAWLGDKPTTSTSSSAPFRGWLALNPCELSEIGGLNLKQVKFFVNFF